MEWDHLEEHALEVNVIGFDIDSLDLLVDKPIAENVDLIFAHQLKADNLAVVQKVLFLFHLAAYVAPNKLNYRN